MGVEAARDLARGRGLAGVGRLLFASTSMPFADLQNASIIQGALGLPGALRTLDIGQSQRAGTAALLDALTAGGDDEALVIASDHPRGKPASTQELTFGAGAAAVARA